MKNKEDDELRALLEEITGSKKTNKETLGEITDGKGDDE